MANELANRFVRDGHDLAYWLWELVGDDMTGRDAAVAAMNAMQEVTPEQVADESAGYFAVRDAFGAEIRRTLARPEFGAARFVRRLVRLMTQSQTLRMRLWDDDNKRVDRVLDKLTPRLKEPGLSEERKQSLTRRVGRVICSGFQGGESQRAQSMLMVHTTTGMQIFAELGEHVLRVPELIREMLRDRQEEHQASSVITKLGPKAAVFADDLIALLDEAESPYGFSPARALAAVIRDDASRVRDLVRRLGSPKQPVAIGAASVLHVLGTRAAELAPECVGTLMALTDASSPIRGIAIAAVGTVARESDAIVKRVLAISLEPDMWVRGEALTALGAMGHRPEWVVPRLVQAFDDYQEPNPDWTYRSRHERVVDALKAFGPAAAPAVPALVERVRNDEGMDRGVVEALTAIGPEAASLALPALEKLAAEYGYDEEMMNDDYDPLPTAIRSLRAGTTSR